MASQGKQQENRTRRGRTAKTSGPGRGVGS